MNYTLLRPPLAQYLTLPKNCSTILQRNMSSNRPSLQGRSSASKPPPPPIHAHPSTLLHPSAALTGTHPITIGPNAIIQLRTRISSAHGLVSIGEGTIISERAILSSPSINTSDTPPTSLTLGPGVVIESGATVEAASIGAYSVIEVGAKIGKGAVIGEHCKVCALVEVGEGEVIGDGTVVYGNGWGERRVERERAGLKALVEAQRHTLKGLWTGK